MNTIMNTTRTGSVLPLLLTKLSPEMQLLICCARVEMVEPFNSHINTLISRGIDWDTVIPSAERHGMVALFHKHLAKFPNGNIPSSFLTQLR